MKRVSIATIAVLAAGIWVTPVTGQGVDEAPSEQVVRELAGIQRSLGDLVELLDTMRTNQDAGIVLRRIELHERRLAPMARRLEANKQDQINTRTNVTDATEWKNRIEDEIREMERDGLDEVRAEHRQQLIIAEGEIERLNRRLEGLQERQIDLENRLDDGRDEVDILDELLQELLGRRPSG